MTATMPPPLGPTADTWGHAEVVGLIAAGPEWPEKVRSYWDATVSDAAHDLAHPRPILGCEGCPQSGLCEWCTKPAPECMDPAGHYRKARESEESLLTVGTDATYGRAGAR